MPRDLVLGNGNVLINFDHGVNMRDFFYPAVGMDNHIAGHRCSIGFWDDGHFSWMDEATWHKSLGYREDTLVTRVESRNTVMGLSSAVAGYGALPPRSVFAPDADNKPGEQAADGPRFFSITIFP